MMTTHTKRITTRMIILVLLIGLFVQPLNAQLDTHPVPDTSRDDTLYPTVAALRDTPIPPRDRVELARRLRGVTEIEPPPESPAPYQLGDRATFTAVEDERGAFEVVAELRALGEHIALWVEVGAQINQTSLNNLARQFDARIYPSVRELWGSENIPGIDGDPRVYGLFAYGLGPTTAAYFTSDHTYPSEAVPTSSEHEMFFFNLDAIGSQADTLEVESIVAHEFQHMIRNNLQANEETWMNEGFSMFTQFYLYRNQPWEAASFMAIPDTQLNNWSEDSFARTANYGGSVLFLTYFYQNYGLEAMQALSADSHPRGLTAVDTILKSIDGESASVDVLFADWVVANGLNDRSDPRYGYTEIPGFNYSAISSRTSARNFSVTEEVFPYATDYYRAPDGMTLDIQFTLPGETTLITHSPADGGHFWYSNRADMSDTTLTREFDLTGVTSATLNYQLWLHTERDWDYGYLLVSEDGGATWDILSTERTTTNDPNQTAYGAGYTGSTRGWVEESVSLDKYAGQVILVRFEMITDDAVNQPGMAIDDVRIPEIGYSDDFETETTDWTAAGWIRTDNRLPQRAWVQLMYHDGDQVVVEQFLHDPNATGSVTSEWTVTIPDGADDALIAVSAFAPVTTTPAVYTLAWSGQ